MYRFIVPMATRFYRAHIYILLEGEADRLLRYDPPTKTTRAALLFPLDCNFVIISHQNNVCFSDMIVLAVFPVYQFFFLTLKQKDANLYIELEHSIVTNGNIQCNYLD